ncbi:hypothetical protein [Mycobacterium sp. 1274761.0]|uniref:hypothetical protein n=1 Tax=Mycobacterium sp. 1274761.0 TaxID=1834077 RepID=UPI000A4DDCE7|nr:hypothetical protein [Mycobacterium sp. 1274761.0]
MPSHEPAGYPLFQQPWPEGEYRIFQLGFVVDDLLAAACRHATVPISASGS